MLAIIKLYAIMENVTQVYFKLIIKISNQKIFLTTNFTNLYTHIIATDRAYFKISEKS